MTATVDEVLL